MNVVPQSVRTPMEEYLATSYRPDCEYVDGEIEERNVGEKEHSVLQQALIFLFRTNRTDWNIEVFPELRVQIGPMRFRVPDVSIVPSGEKWERVLCKPALLFIEILSPEDTLRKMRERVDDYLNFGTEHVWIIDPGLRKAYICSKKGFQEPDSGVLAVPGTPIRVTLSELFAELDRA